MNKDSAAHSFEETSSLARLHLTLQPLNTCAQVLHICLSFWNRWEDLLNLCQPLPLLAYGLITYPEVVWHARIKVKLSLDTSFFQSLLHDIRIVSQRIKLARSEVHWWEVLVVLSCQDREDIRIFGISSDMPIISSDKLSNSRCEAKNTFRRCPYYPCR